MRGFVVAVMTVATTLLWSSWVLTRRWLRTLELLIFGAAAAFFLWLQFAVFHNGKVLEVANRRYWIAPRVELADTDGVCVACKPDFVIWPGKASAARRPAPAKLPHSTTVARICN